jgi:deoxyhypusine synthase
LKNLKQISLKKGITAGELVEEMDSCGVLGAGKIGKASRLIKQMFEDSDYTVFLSIAGALVAGGLRTIIAQLLESEHVEVVVTTGANMVHDMLESLGCKHKIGTFRAEDYILNTKLSENWRDGSTLSWMKSLKQNV